MRANRRTARIAAGCLGLSLAAAGMARAQCANPVQIPNQTISSGAVNFTDANALRADGVVINGGASVNFIAGNCINTKAGFRATAGTAGTTFHGWVQTAPAAVSVAPASGSGLSQTFTWTASSPAGYVNLMEIYGRFGTSAYEGVNTCYIRYDRVNNLLWLADNGASYWMGGFAPGSAQTVENSQCKVFGTGAAVSGAGPQLAVAVPVEFKAGFSGTKNNYMFARDNIGQSSPWQQMGTWTVAGGQQYLLTAWVVPAGPPAGGTVGLNPAGGSYPGGTPVQVTAAPAAGYTFTGWSGDASGTANPLTVTMSANKTVTANFVASASNNAACVETNRPENVFPGQQFTAVIKMQNVGTSTWSGGSYKLGATNPNDNLTWGLNRVALPQSVSPGQQVTLAFDVTAPGAPGAYSFNWRMVQDGVGFFGQECQRAKPVTVQSLALENGVSPIAAPSELEVNLGPMPIDRYNDLNCRPGKTCIADPPVGSEANTYKSLAGCDPGFTVRQCIQNALRGYKIQGVKGVRFQFGICGGAESTALTGCRQYSHPSEEGTGIYLSETWAGKLETFFGDVRTQLNTGSGPVYVTPTPALTGFGGDAGTFWRKADGSCYTFPDFYKDAENEPGVRFTEDPLRPGATPQTPIEWWPASPYAVVPDVQPDDPKCPRHVEVTPGAHLIDANQSYALSPKNRYNFVGWNNLLTVFRRMIEAIHKTDGLTLREFDITNELHLSLAPVQARLIYDNHRFVDVFTEVRNRVSTPYLGKTFDPNLVTFSVVGKDSLRENFACNSVYGDHAKVIDLSALYAGLRGGLVGRPLGDPDSESGLWCEGGYTGMVEVLGARQLPSIADIHATPCLVSSLQGRCDAYQSVQTAEIEASGTFNAVASLLQSYCVGGWREEKIAEICNAKFILGEVAVKKDPPVTDVRPDRLPSNCDGSPPSGPEGAVRGFNSSGLAGRSTGTVIRPWVDAMNTSSGGQVCYELPHNLRRTYAPQQ